MSEVWEPNLSQVCLEDLSSGYREVADVIGLEAALRLVQAFGGVRFAVPRKCAAQHPLTIALGEEAVLSLERFCGGTELRIPTAAQACRGRRDRAITAERAAGRAVQELARRFGLDERRVQQILREKRG